MEIELLNHLDKKDHAELMILSQRSLSCKNENDLVKLVLDLKNLFYHDRAVLASGNIAEVFSNRKPDRKPEINCLNMGYPQSYLDHYFENQYYKSDITLHEYLQHLKPVHFATFEEKMRCSHPAGILSMEYNIPDGWAYGTFDPGSMNCCVFYMVASTQNSPRNRTILKYITPFFTEAYRHILNAYRGPVSNLTPSEIEVLKWLKLGKSSWDISMILKCSKRVIDFHVTNIKKKLDAVSRAQAVAIGLHQGIITF